MHRAHEARLADGAIVFEAIGTTWRIDLPTELSRERRADIFFRIKERVEQFDKNYSRFRADSLVTAMMQPGTYTLPPDAAPLFSLYEKLYRLTGGRMTPLTGQLLADAGYDADYSFERRHLRELPTWEAALEYAYPTLTIKQPGILDLGAAGKGYLIDIIAAILHADGIPAFCIDAGGDILYHGDGDTPLRVGLEDPNNERRVIGVAEIRNQSLCGSAGNRRAWDDFHHIIDPKTKASPRHLLATWAVADSAILADALATALFLVDSERLSAAWSFEYLLLYPDYSVARSDHFPAELFTSSSDTYDPRA